jgi:hypothetical protein
MVAKHSVVAKTDSALKQQLAEATEGGEIEAVVKLKPDSPGEIVPTAPRTTEITEKILKRVARTMGKPASRFNVFKNFGSFVVSSDPAFIKELMAQPEVATVMANRQYESAFIEPVESKPLPTEKQKRTAARAPRVSRAAAKKSTRKRTKASARTKKSPT